MNSEIDDSTSENKARGYQIFDPFYDCGMRNSGPRIAIFNIEVNDTLINFLQFLFSVGFSICLYHSFMIF